ncbi:MAG: YueI family protein [Bacillus sp. (in: firmicutes)]
MAKKTVEDILEQGIYGAKEINPEERKRFLGTIRERIFIALTIQEVREAQIQPLVLKSLEENKGAKLLLNGDLDYTHLSKYMKAAKKYGIDYKMVTNKDHQTDIGMVLAYDDAIDREYIFLKELQPETLINVSQTNGKKKGLLSSLKFWKR